MPEISRDYRISKEHPTLSGHFPGNPVIPGVVILDHARQLFEDSFKGKRIKKMNNIKFMRPLFPEQEFCIRLKEVAEDKIKFDCIFDGEKMIHGTFIIENKS